MICECCEYRDGRLVIVVTFAGHDAVARAHWWMLENRPAGSPARSWTATPTEPGDREYSALTGDLSLPARALIRNTRGGHRAATVPGSRAALAKMKVKRMTTQAATAKTIILSLASSERIPVDDDHAGGMASAAVAEILVAIQNRRDPAAAAALACSAYASENSLSLTEDQAGRLGASIANAPDQPAGR